MLLSTYVARYSTALSLYFHFNTDTLLVLGLISDGHAICWAKEIQATDIANFLCQFEFLHDWLKH